MPSNSVVQNAAASSRQAVGALVVTAGTVVGVALSGGVAGGSVVERSVVGDSVAGGTVVAGAVAGAVGGAVAAPATGASSDPPHAGRTMVTVARAARVVRVVFTAGSLCRLIVVDLADGTQLTSVPGVPVPEDDIIWTIEPEAGADGRVLRRPASVAVAGDTLLVGTMDGSLRLFDAATIELQRTITAAANTLGNLRPLADGTVVTSGRFGLGRIDLTTGEAKWQVIEQETCVNITVAEQRGLFYCGDPYGRLHEHDLGSGVQVRTLDAQNGNTGSLWTAGGGTELVSFGTFEPVVARWRLDGSGPITRVASPGWAPNSFNHASGLLLIETGHILDGDYAAQVIDAASDDVVARPDGLIVPAWNSSDTLLGATLGNTGLVETAEYDLDDGSLTSFGNGVPLAEALTIAANELDTGKEHAIFRYREGTDNWLARFDTATLRAGPRIPIDGLVSWAITRAGDRIAAGTTSGVHVYDAFDRRTDRLDPRFGSAQRLHHRHRPALRRLARRRASPVRPRHTATDPDVRRQPRPRVRRSRHRRRFARRHQRRRPPRRALRHSHRRPDRHPDHRARGPAEPGPPLARRPMARPRR